MTLLKRIQILRLVDVASGRRICTRETRSMSQKVRLLVLLPQLQVTVVAHVDLTFFNRGNWLEVLHGARALHPLNGLVLRFGHIVHILLVLSRIFFEVEIFGILIFLSFCLALRDVY